MDLAGVNDYQIKFSQLDIKGKIRGNWTFSFTADGSTLMAETQRVTLDKTFTLPNCVSITLEEFTSNDLEQRILYTAYAKEAVEYDLLVTALDEMGGEYSFYLSSFNGSRKKGYLRAQETRIQMCIRDRSRRKRRPEAPGYSENGLTFAADSPGYSPIPVHRGQKRPSGFPPAVFPEEVLLQRQAAVFLLRE